MGGKAQRAQRTKNNARPSSSGRSAELLSNTIKDPVLFGAGSGQPLKPFFPTLATVNFDHGLNTDYTLCFKKFNKKDPITKTKALQELHELTKTSNVDDVVAALPAWAHFYPVLTIDTDRKVRECTQACHASIARASGRRLALQLRRLLPAWLLAQSDDYAPAQYHAHASLTNTFPEGKLAEAITFCKVEIITLLLENIKGNAEGMLVKKFENEEEKNMQVGHIVASSLRALQLLVAQLPAAHGAWLWDALRPLLSDAAFWKLVQNSTDQSHVRGAWYGVVGRLVERFREQFGAEYGARAGRALLAQPERPPAAAQRWAALLLLMKNVENWPTWFNKKDLLVKRILDVLENGGWGDASLQSELLLPLLAHLPPELVTKDFYEGFFTASIVGLEKKNVLSSKSERQAWSRNMAECLRYLSEQGYEFVLECTTSAHRSWLSRVLAVREGQCRTHLIRHTAANVAALFKFWLERTKEVGSDKYDQLLRTCWQNIGSIISSQIDGLSAESGDVSIVVDGHILLLQNLKTSFNQEEKKHFSIKFADDPEVGAEAKEVMTKVECDAELSGRYQHSLHETAERACALYLEFALRHGSAQAVLAPLLSLLVEFESERLYAALARHFGATGAYGLYERVLHARLQDAARCKPLLDLVFLSLKYMSEEEQNCVFDSFEQLEQRAAEWCLALCVSHPHCAARAPSRWLRGARAQRALPPLCARMLQLGDREAGALLLRCLTHSVDGESVTSEETVSEVVRQVCGAVAAAELDAPELERRARTAAQLCSSLAAARSPHEGALGALAAALFALQLRVPRGDARLPLDTWLEVRSSWQDALGSLHGAPRRALLGDMIALVHQKLFENSDKLDEIQINNTVALLPYALSASVAASATLDRDDLVGFTAQLLAFPERSVPATGSVELCALRNDFIMGNLNCPFDDNNELVKKIIDESSSAHFVELDREDFMFNAQKLLFKSSYLRTILLRYNGYLEEEERLTAVEDEEEDTQLHWCNDILSEEYIKKEFLTLLYEHMVIVTLDEGYAFWPGHDILRRTKLLLDDLIKDIIKEMSAEIRQKMHTKLTDKSASVGYYWSYALRYFEVEARVNRADTVIKQCADLECNVVEKDKTKVKEESEVIEKSKAEVKPEVEKKLDLEEKSNVDEKLGVEMNVNIEVDTKEEIAEKELHKEFDLAQIVTGSGYFHSLQADLKWRDTKEDTEARLRCRFATALRGVHAALGADAGARLLNEWLACAARSVRDCNLDVLVDLHCRRPELVLAEREILSAPWAHVVSNAAILDLADELVCARGWELPPHHWDFVTLTLTALLESLALSVDNWGCTKVALLCRSALQLFARVRVFVADIRRASEQRRPSAHLLALATEWDDIFAPSINMHIFKIITTILRSAGRSVTCAHACVADALAGGVTHLQWEMLPAEQRSGELARERLARAAADALRDDARAPVQLLAYNLLRALAEGLVLDDACKLAQWREAEEGGPRGALTLAQCDAALTHLQELLDAALSDLDVCQSCELVAGSDSERVARAYLLLAVAAYEQYRLARGDLVHHYIEHYRGRKYGEYMISCSARLLPAALAAYAQDDTAATPLPARFLHCFDSAPDFSVEEICSRESVGALACRALLASLAGAGCADARGWWGALGARQARAVRRLVSACVAPPLHRAQLADLKRRAAALSEPEVSVAQVSVASGGEARCVLLVEEHALELCVQLSEAHPLVPPRVTADALPAAPNTTHWLTVYLAYQNGSLFNAFRMWIRAVSARIENSPQCYICYCRLHPASGRLPSVHCRQCRNKFHSPCLRKWFTTSNKTNCPLCRSSF